MSAQFVQLLQFTSNLLFLGICWRQHRKNYEDESKWHNTLEIGLKFFKHVKRMLLEMPEARRQLRQEIAKHIIPFLAWFALSKVLVGLSGGNVFLSFLVDIGLAVLILAPIALLILAIKKNQIYPENKLGQRIRTELIPDIQDDLLERLEAGESAVTRADELMIEESEQAFREPKFGYGFIEKYEHYDWWVAPHGDEAVLWGFYLNDVEIIVSSFAEVKAKETEEERHQEFLRSERSEKRTFLIISAIIFAPLILDTFGKIFDAFF